MLSQGPFRPPSKNNKTTADTTANTVIHVQSGLGGLGRVLGLLCTSDFNITFYDDGTAPDDPGDTSDFPAGFYLFELGPKNIGFKLNPHTSSKVLTYWKASSV